MLDCLDPFAGGRRGDERIGVLASMLAGLGGERKRPSDYLLHDPDKYAPRPMNQQALKGTLKAMTLAMGGEVIE